MSATTLGLLIISLLVLLQCAYFVKQLFEKRADKEAVPRKDHDELRDQVDKIHTNSVGRKEHDELKQQAANHAAQVVALTSRLVEYVTRHEMDELRTELTRQYEKLEKYARSRSHKLTAQVHEIQMGLEVLHRNIQVEMSSLIGRVTEKQERHQVALSEIRAMIERRFSATSLDEVDTTRRSS